MTKCLHKLAKLVSMNFPVQPVTNVSHKIFLIDTFD